MSADVAVHMLRCSASSLVVALLQDAEIWHWMRNIVTPYLHAEERYLHEGA